jgi:serine/threonine protein kinase
MIGQTISHYKILEKLGEGGMGVVYKAQDTTLDRIVALKFLPAHLAASEQDKARFLQEAKLAATLNHPNICTIHAIEEHEGQQFIAMEFVEGQTLREKSFVGADRRSPLSIKQSIDIAIQIADGLAAAHEKGIVHRDIKPENIMIRKDDIVQIMDFGLAKLRGASRLTKDGATVGTIGYMSPEQVQGQEADHRSDIFSLGVILYELLSGQSPFRGMHETAIMYEIVNVDVAPISSLKPEIDPALDAIALECLAKEKIDRYQSAAEVSKELRRFKRESSKARVSRASMTHEAYRPSGVQSSVTVLPQPELIPQAERFSLKKLLTPERLGWSVAVLVFATLALLHLMERSPEGRVTRSTILPPEKLNFSTTFGGHIALSPDGKLLAFVSRDTASQTRLWVRPLNALTGQALNGTDGASFPFWSPDSRFIGFFADGKLKKIEASGGPPQTLCDATGGRGGTWNEKGTIVFCPSGGVFPLSRVSAAGGVPVAITKLDSSVSQTSHRWPYFLPDGEHFLFSTRTSFGGVGDGDGIFVGSLDTTFVPRRLVNSGSSAAFANGHLLFAREQTLMAQPFDLKTLSVVGDAVPIAERVYFESFTSKTSFSTSQNGTLVYQTGTSSSGIKLVWYDRSGKQTNTINKYSVFNDLRISPDGKRIAVSQFDDKNRNTDIWLYDISRSFWTRFTFDAAGERWPIWSPDGNSILFASDRKKRNDMFQRAASGAGGEELLLESNLQKYPSDWSRDGKLIAYTTLDQKNREDIWILPMKGDRKPFLFLQTEFSETRATFSPDGRWIAYQSDESGRLEIYVRPFPGSGGKFQASTNGGLRPRWRRDGKELFFLSLENKVMAAEIKLGAANVEVGAVLSLFPINPFGGGGRDIYDVTGDGQRFLVATPGVEESSAPVTLVANWNAELKKQ